MRRNLLGCWTLGDSVMYYCSKSHVTHLPGTTQTQLCLEWCMQRAHKHRTILDTFHSFSMHFMVVERTGVLFSTLACVLVSLCQSFGMALPYAWIDSKSFRWSNFFLTVQIQKAFDVVFFNGIFLYLLRVTKFTNPGIMLTSKPFEVSIGVVSHSDRPSR